METKNNTAKTVQDAAQGGIKIREILSLCLAKWYWFVLSVIVCVGVASVKLLKTVPVYSRTATLLIKETTVRRATNSELESVLSNGGMGVTTSKLVNEIVAFKSPTLMEEVVSRLKLDVEYSVHGTFHDNVIYGSKCPIDITFLDGDMVPSSSFVVSPLPDGSISISQFVSKDLGSKSKLSYKCALGDTLATKVGKLVVNRSLASGVSFNTPISVRKVGVKSAAVRFSAAFSANELDLKNRSDVLTLSLRDVNTERAEDILNVLIAVYNENWVSDKNVVSVSTAGFIKDRLAAIESELSNVDDEISNFKSRNLIPDVNAVSTMYMTQSAENARALQDLESQLAVSNYVKSMLLDVNNKKQLIPMATSIGNSAISSQINEYNRALLTRNSMASNSSEENPLVIDMDKGLDAMRDAISVSVDNQIASIETQIKNIHNNELKNAEKIAANPSQAKYLLSVGRRQKVMESLYLYLLQKREENELSQAFAAYNTKLITPPSGSSMPVSPQKSKVLLIALMIGLFIPVVVIYLMDILNTSVHTRKDFEGSVVPFLGEIPLFEVPGKKKRIKLNLDRKDIESKKLVAVHEGKRDVINEAFRMLRTNLEFVARDHNDKVFIITSFNAGSGKTFISSNLAITFAIKKHKVLVIDGDLRHTSLSKYVDSPKKGIVDYLGGFIQDVDSIIIRDALGFKRLDILPVGITPPNPTELISDRKFADMVEKYRSQYDYIFIDCPPVDVVADTQIISSLADRTIFIARSGLLDKSMVPEIDELYQNGRCKNISLVLNGTNLKDPRYSYRSGYKYGYRYGSRYGYNSSYQYGGDSAE